MSQTVNEAAQLLLDAMTNKGGLVDSITFKMQNGNTFTMEVRDDLSKLLSAHLLMELSSLTRNTNPLPQHGELKSHPFFDGRNPGFPPADPQGSWLVFVGDTLDTNGPYTESILRKLHLEDKIEDTTRVTNDPGDPTKDTTIGELFKGLSGHGSDCDD